MGQLADAKASGSQSATPVLVPGSSAVRQVVSGANHTCALTTAGAVYCSGSGFVGQLGTVAANAFATQLTDPVNGISDASAIAAGGDVTCAIVASGKVKCWGANFAGQLGDGTTTDSRNPVTVQADGGGDLTGASRVSVAGDHVCALVPATAPGATGSAAVCWGANESGQVGDGTTTERHAAHSTFAFSEATDVVAGSGFTCAAFSAGPGAASCWGYNGSGQLGDGTNDSSLAPVSVLTAAATPLTGVTALTAGGAHVCALVAGAVRCWGDNQFGQLGDGTSTSNSYATAVSGLSSAQKISAGLGHSCAMLSSGTVKCWGRNSFGQLGTGSVTARSLTAATVTYSAVPPTPSITSTALTGTTASGSETITFTGSGAVGVGSAPNSLECSFDGTPWTDCSSGSFATGSFADGAHTFSVREVTYWGVTGGSADLSWSSDTTAPSIPSISSPYPTGSVSSKAATITFTGIDAGATPECSLDDVTYGACTTSGTYVLSGLSEGTVTVYVRARDAVGNRSAPDSVTWTVDTVAPSAPTITDNPADPSNATSPSFSFTGEAGATFRCRLDSGSYAICSSGDTFTVAAGSHRFYVKQTDAAGNESPAADYGWTVDLTAPAVPTIGSAPSGLVNSASASISFSGIEAGATAECSLDGVSYSACDSSTAHALSGLSDGSVTFHVRAVDAAGNAGVADTATWTVDTTKPAKPSISPVTRNTANPSITFAAAEAGGTLKCSTDGSSYSTCSSPYTGFTGLADGSTNDFYVTQTDAAGNTSDAQHVTWTVDLTSPAAPSITSQPAARTNSTGDSVAFTGAEAGGSFTCSVDGGSYSPCSSPKVVSGLAEGAHTVAVKQIDAAGNTGSAATASWVVDLTAPAKPTIGSAPSGLVSSASASISFSGIEAGATAECSLDGVSYSACDSSTAHALSGLADGSVTFHVRAVDAAGNAGVADTATWTVDTTKPGKPAITSGPNALVAVATASVAFTGEAGASFECALDSGSFSSCTSPKSLTGLSDGSHTFYVRQTDAAGNQGDAQTRTWTVDTTKPAKPTITAAPTGTQIVGTGDISFTGVEAGATVECSTDGTTYAACTSPVTLTGLADGAVTFRVRQTDTAGNVGDDQTASWTVNTTKPGIPTFNNPKPAAQTQSTQETINFTPGSGAASVECSLDGDTWITCLSGRRITVAEGSHTFSLRSVNAYGNRGSETSYSWTVDLTPPAKPTFTAKPASLTNSATASVSFTEAGDSDHALCKFDSGSYAGCTSPLSSFALAEGSHTVYVKSVDAAGNESAVESWTWTVDLTPPGQPAITGKPSDPTNATSATINFTAGSGSSSTVCKLDSGAYSTCTSGKSYSSLSEGSHTVSLKAVDAAGNESTVESYTWTVDTTPPGKPSVSAKPANPTNSTSALVSFTGGSTSTRTECKLDSGSYATCTSPFTQSGLSEGSHTVSLRSYDAAGNVGAVESYTWVVDLTVSPPSITGKPSSPSNVGRPTFSFTGESGATFECRVDSEAYAACTSGFQVHSGAAVLTDGSHTFNVRQTDPAGNLSSAASYTWTVKTTAPATPVIVSAPSGTVRSTSGTVTFTADSSGGNVVSCSLNSASFGSCSSPVSLSSLPQGANMYRVRVTDTAGNTSMATATWTADTVGPVPPTVGAPDGPYRYTSINAAITSEPGATFTCSLDGAFPSACTSPFTATGLASGNHSLSVWATDAVGNIGSATTHRWTVDTVAPPAPTISGLPTSSTTATSVTVSFASQAGATFLCSVDGATFASCSSPKVISGVAAGSHTIAAKAVDPAGNVSAQTARGWTVLIAAPKVPCPAPAVTRPLVGTIPAPGEIGNFKWSVTPNAAPSAPDTRSACQMGTLQVSSAVAAPSASQPAIPFTYADGIYAYSAVIYRTGDIPRWVRAQNRIGAWSAWTALIKR